MTKCDPMYSLKISRKPLIHKKDTAPENVLVCGLPIILVASNRVILTRLQ